MNEQSNIYLPHLMVIEKITHPAFQEITDFVLNLDGNPLLIAGIATMLMAGVMNSSSGSMA